MLVHLMLVYSHMFQVSKDGEITLVAPLDINPSYENARISFKTQGHQSYISRGI